MTTTTKTRLSELTELLTDPETERPTRLLRLQGWRGDDLACALDSGNATRLGPASCAVMAFGVAVTGSVPLAVIAGATALIGAFASNHPFEMAYNAVARRTGRTPVPANRAAKRLGCAIGTLMLAVSAVALATGATALGVGVAAFLGALAAFVAASNICVPSIMFTLLFGERKATAATLVSAAAEGTAVPETSAARVG
jgi:hypothetical protein